MTETPPGRQRDDDTNGRLTLEQVRDRLQAYDTPDNDAVLEQLFRFGELGLQEKIGRTDSLETKAAMGLGFATAALAFVFDQPLVVHRYPTTSFALSCVGGAVLVAAALTAALALAVRRWRWFSAATWFLDPAKVTSVGDVLYNHVLEVFTIAEKMEAANVQKARYVTATQWLLAMAALVLLGLLLAARA